MEYFIGFIVIVLIVAFVGALRAQKAAREKLILSLKEGFGKEKEQEYTVERFKSLGFYFRSHNDGALDIDDITVNDVDLDQVFMCMNNTCSAAGEEYLYATLRKPVKDEGVLKERDRVAEFFGAEPEKRLKMQLLLSDLGKTRSVSLYEYLNRLNNAPTESNLLHYAVLLLYFAAAVLFVLGAFVSSSITPFAILVLIGGIIYSIVSYFRCKASKEIYLNVIGILVNMINLSKEVDKFKDEELKTYVSNIHQASKNLEKISKNSFILTVKGGNIIDILLDYVRMLTHLDLVKFNNVIKLYRENTDSLNILYENYGFLDSMIAVASFRKWLSDWSRPEFQTEKGFEAENLYHPLIVNPVKNSIKSEKSVLLTGSNASGKSTFIKALAINAILAETVYTSVADSYRAPFFKILSSMALRDNLSGGESYYIVEIKSLKRILDAINDETPVLCFVDEVLRGTNTLERVAASSRILYDLSTKNCVCFAATHDLELASILENSFDSFHFSEKVTESDVVFDYLLKPGKATSRNAIRLLEKTGYPKEITESAKLAAEQFTATNTWERIV